jgi:aryl-alcohol dehydrogenase-like predicted oxidoreductase
MSTTSVTLGRTGLVVRKDGLGALPIQRRSVAEALPILRAAVAGGINFIDTARSYTDSEAKIGAALADQRDAFTLATKTPAKDAAGFRRDLDTSLGLLKTDHIDIYQFHNPEKMPTPGDGTGLYEAALEAREQGKIDFIGITNHRLAVATAAVESGLYDTVQFPFSHLSGDTDIALVKLCAAKNVGFIAMKALSGGLITDIAAAHAFMSTFDNVVPIWGIQHRHELDQLLALVDKAPGITADEQAKIDADRAELQGDFCRSCGYCSPAASPCPAGIKIFNAARTRLLLRRMPSAQWLTPEWQAEMEKIRDCKHCNACKKRCPYGLDVPALLEKNYADYREYLAKTA